MTKAPEVKSYEVTRKFWDGEKVVHPNMGADSIVRMVEGTQPRSAKLNASFDTPEAAETTAVVEPQKDEEPVTAPVTLSGIAKAEPAAAKAK